jgi:HAD superfamily hydrolase (TIGR01509 family)
MKLSEVVNMIKTVIFDMDGTLINSDALVEKIYRELVKEYPPIISFDSLDLNQVMALSYIEVIKILYGDVKPIYLDYIMYVHAKEKKGQLAIFPEVIPMLKDLKNQGMYLAVVTSELREIAIDEMQILGILHYFNEVVAFDDVTHPKPHPEGILRILEHSHAQPYEAIMVGDQLSDAFAAEKAHVMSILMGWDENKVKSMAIHYDDVAMNTTQVLDIIKNRQQLKLKFNQDGILTLCQITDLHLMHDEKNLSAKTLINSMVNHIHPDFIALTGDQTMGEHGKMSYHQLGQWMDEINIPYGFVFGNHDTEGGSYESLISAIQPSKTLMFTSGPKHLGYSNYWLEVYEGKEIKALIIMMDSHIDAMYEIDNQKVWGYGSIDQAQMMWYERLSNRYPNIPSLLFLHIPPYEVRHIKQSEVIGVYEESPSTPPVDFGFVKLVQSLGHTQAIFFGHDHYNDFIYSDHGLMLAYGRVSGYYVYGREGFTPGTRWIKLSTKGNVTTGILTMDQLHKVY